VDAIQIAGLVKDYGTIAFLALSLLVNKILWDYIKTLLAKIEGLNEEWRKDSQAQSDKLAEVLLHNPEPTRRR